MLVKNSGIWLVLCTMLSAGKAVGEVPVADFFRDYQISQLNISPNGRYIAALVPVNDSANVAIIDRIEKTNSAITRYNPPGKVLRVHWKSDDRLFYVLRGTQNTTYQTHSLITIGRDGKGLTSLAQYVNTNEGAVYDGMVDWLPELPDKVLMEGVAKGASDASVYERTLVGSHEETKVAFSGGHHCDYWTDGKGAVRLCLSH